MSRITEEEFSMIDSLRDAALKQPKDHSTMSIASRIRNMAVPSQTGDVDKFLDAVFDKVNF